MSKSETISGVGFPSLLGLLFIGLKLGHVITWPWVWVLAPLWVPAALVLVILFIILFFVGLGLLLEARK